MRKNDGQNLFLGSLVCTGENAAYNKTKYANTTTDSASFFQYPRSLNGSQGNCNTQECIQNEMITIIFSHFSEFTFGKRYILGI